MCGRVTFTLDKDTVMEILGDIFNVSNQPSLPAEPNYNIGPSSNLLSVIETDAIRRAGYLKWGFVPSWAKDKSISYSLINARSETVDTKAMFRDSFKTKRCILLADSFYEWKREKTKRPFRFQITDQPLMPFAGIYSKYIRKDGSSLFTCSVLTCEPNGIMSPIHNRMPVILTPDAVNGWLDQTAEPSSLKDLLTPYDASKMSVYEVSPFVNSVKNNSPKCIEPIGDQQSLF